MRNSWGEEWACESPEVRGHALMPYAYVERYVHEAFTGPLDANAAFAQPVQNFRTALANPGREEQNGGRLLQAGTWVLRDRFDGNAFREDTQINEQRFIDRDFTWTDNSWRRVWFLNEAQFSGKTTAKLNSNRAARERFASAIHDNMTSMTASDEGPAPYPQLRAPWWHSVVPFDWSPKVKKVDVVANLTDSVARVIQERAGSPPGLDWTKQWQDLLVGVNDIKVYAIRRNRKLIHVLSAFVSPMKVQKGADPSIVPLDQALIDAVKKIYSTWSKTQGKSQPGFTYMTIAGMECSLPDSSAVSAGDHLLLLSWLDCNGRWKTQMPERFGDRPCIRDFLDRLKPETAKERVKHCVDKLIRVGGNVTIERVKAETNYHKSVILRAFLKMQEQADDPYRLYKTQNGNIAIRRPEPGDRKKIKADGILFRRHGFRIAGIVVGYCAWAILNTLGLGGYLGVITAILVLYASSCIQGVLNRCAEKDKE